MKYLAKDPLRSSTKWLSTSTAMMKMTEAIRALVYQRLNMKRNFKIFSPYSPKLHRRKLSVKGWVGTGVQLEEE